MAAERRAGEATGVVVPGRSEQIATRVVFFVSGLALASWAPLVPYAKQRLGVGEGGLGMLLLCMGVGSLLIMPAAGPLTARIGCRMAIRISALAICVLLPFLAVVSHSWSLALVLLLFGAAEGVLNVSMNIHAVIVEKAGGRTMMSGFHGLYSVGGFVGAGCISALLWLDAAPFQAILVTVVAMVVLIAVFSGRLLLYGREGSGQLPLFVMPRGIVALIGLLCLIVFLAEGAVLDWSAVFLTTQDRLDAAHAGFGYAVFAIAMTVGRLTGDRIVQWLGGRRIVLVGGVLAAAGFLLAVFVPFWLAGLAGFAMIGLGCANIVPVLYSLSGRQQVMPPNLAVASVSALGYAGVLAGPALIGFIAHATSLAFAFICVAALLLLVAANSRIVDRVD